MKGNTKMTFDMEKAASPGQMDENMMEDGKKDNNTALEYSGLLMERRGKESGKKECLLNGQRKINK